MSKAQFKETGFWKRLDGILILVLQVTGAVISYLHMTTSILHKLEFLLVIMKGSRSSVTERGNKAFLHRD